MPTIYEIAKAAGVAPGTVSKALNRTGRVNEETRKRIEKIAEDMSYVPNVAARGLKSNQSFMIGIVFPENAGIGLKHMFFSELLESFRHEMAEYGYDTIFINKRLDGKDIGYLEHCKMRKVDGLLIITIDPNDSEMDQLLDSKIPSVSTEMALASIPYVMSDNIEGGRLAAEYLMKMGHTQVGHLAGVLNTVAGLERLDGFRKGLEKAGLSLKDQYIESLGWTYNESIEETIKNYINRFKLEERPTALFVASDLMAVHTINILAKMGISVPEDISIIGFDDIQIAKIINPGLTTIHQDIPGIAKGIVDILYQLIKKEEVDQLCKKIPVTLVERGSVKKL